MMAALVVSDEEIDVEKVKKELAEATTDYNSEKFMDSVSTKEEKVYGNDEERQL